MEQDFVTTLAASLVAGAVTTAGIYTIRRFEIWARQNTTYFACFAAGVLIAVSFLHIVPKSFTMNSQAPIYLFTGYLSMHLFNRFLTAYVCDKPATTKYALGLVPLFGIGFHSFLDGVVYSISFSVSMFTGSLEAPLDHSPAGRESIAMALWLVTASWSDDEAELTQQWEVNVPTEDEAVREVVMLLPSKPQHVEVKLLSEDLVSDLGPGQARKLS